MSQMTDLAQDWAEIRGPIEQAYTWAHICSLGHHMYQQWPENLLHRAKFPKGSKSLSTPYFSKKGGRLKLNYIIRS